MKEIEFFRSEKAEYIGSMLGGIIIKKTIETVAFITFNDDDIIIKDILDDEGTKILYDGIPKELLDN